MVNRNLFEKSTAKYLLIIIFSLVVNTTFSQNQPLSNAINVDFCKNAVLNFKHGNDAFKSWMIQSARSIGLNDIEEINRGVENIIDNDKLRDAFLLHIVMIGGSKDFIANQFYSIGMKLENAKIIAEYAIFKYNEKANSIIEDEETVVNQTNEISNHILLKSLYPEGTFENDSIIIRKISAVDINGGDNIDVTLKTGIVKKFKFENEISDGRNGTNLVNQMAVVISSIVPQLNPDKKHLPQYDVLILQESSDGNWKSRNSRRIDLYDTSTTNSDRFDCVQMVLIDDKYFLIFESNFENKRTLKYVDIKTFNVEKIKTYTKTIIKN